ncbi:MAG: LLM class flavin-dependent oxidoreductase [Actinomycetota bacterium]|nr:LLM class flavin-dependent oxidoreductase [Actinomycetota bacterium]
MDYGAHLPLIALNRQTWTLQRLLEYAEIAESVGFQALSVNDHLIFSRPWLDGPTALAAVLTRTGQMVLATTVALPVVRGPVALAKSLVAIDLLSGGRLIVGVGPGSSDRDYAAVGVPFEERWKRLDEAVQALRALWQGEGPPFRGEFYSTDLHASGKDPNRFPNAIATMFFYVSEERATSKRIVREVLSPTLNRPEEELRQRLLVGPAEECAEKLAAYRAAGAHRIFLWPVEDELRQLATFQERVAPLVGS